MNIKKEIGTKIKKIRKKRGLTQEKLSEIIDITPRNLSKIEIGLNFPKPETLEKILCALNVTTEELFSNDHIKDKKELMDSIISNIQELEDDEIKLQTVYKIVNCIKYL